MKFTLLSKYARCLVASATNLMNRFIMQVSEFVEEECRMEMIVDEMNLSRLIVFSQKI